VRRHANAIRAQRLCSVHGNERYRTAERANDADRAHALQTRKPDDFFDVNVVTKAMFAGRLTRARLHSAKRQSFENLASDTDALQSMRWSVFWASAFIFGSVVL